MTSNLKFFSNEWGSGEIRAKQVANYLNADCDKLEVTNDDVCISIKHIFEDNFVKHAKKCYVDVVDNYGSLEWLKSHEDVGCIVLGKLAKQYATNYLHRDVVMIPEHHCNFENTILHIEKPKTVGFIGYAESFHLDVDAVSRMIQQLGMRFKYCTNFNNRQDVVDFYRSIDIQLTYRVENIENHLKPELKNPLKVINAGSFGIPTVGYPEPSYIAEGVTFAKAENMYTIAYQLNRLMRDRSFYNDLSNTAIKEAKAYHISNISKKYLELLHD